MFGGFADSCDDLYLELSNYVERSTDTYHIDLDCHTKLDFEVLQTLSNYVQYKDKTMKDICCTTCVFAMTRASVGIPIFLNFNTILFCGLTEIKETKFCLFLFILF